MLSGSANVDVVSHDVFDEIGAGGIVISGTADVGRTALEYSFFDSFTDSGSVDLSVHSPEIGGAWNSLTGTNTVASGYLTQDGAFTAISATNDFVLPRVTAIFDLEFAAGFNSGMTIDFNKLDSNNCWVLYHSPPYFTLFEITNGVSVSRASYTDVFGYTSMQLILQLNGDTINVYKDSVLIMTYTVSNRANKNHTKFSLNWFKTSGFLRYNKIVAYTDHIITGGVLVAGTGIDSVSGGGPFTQLIDTFTSGGVSDPSDSGPVRNLLGGPYGSAFIEDGILKWEQLGGLDITPSVMTWNDLLIGGSLSSQVSITVIFAQFGDGFGGRIYFCCDNTSLQNGYVLNVPSDDVANLNHISSGAETAVTTSSTPLEGGTPTNVVVTINIDGGVIYAEIVDDVNPTPSVVYEFSLGAEYAYQTFAIGINGTNSSNAAWLDSVQIASNLYILLDTFTSPGTPGDQLSDYTTDDGHTRTVTDGSIVYSTDTGIGAMCTVNSADFAKLSYGNIGTSFDMLVRLQLLTVPARIYFNGDSDSFANGWCVEVTNSYVKTIRIDSGVDTVIASDTWTLTTAEARLSISTIGASINVSALGFNGNTLEGTSINLSDSMGGFYDSQGYIGLGFKESPDHSQCFYFRIN